MELLSSFFGSEQRNAKQKEAEAQRRKMNDGYPMTKSPFVPEILKQAVDFTNIQNKNGDAIIRLTFASKGSKLVEPECLDEICETMHERYEKNGLVSKNFNIELPRNTIAVSFAEQNFKVGNSCQEFSLIDKFKATKSSHFYYQKLSENFQVTYYNEDGIEFVAGYCYYPPPIGKPLLLSNDKALMYSSYISAKEYPLADRDKAVRTVEHKSYGRFCETAKKRVIASFGGWEPKICHEEFDHVSRQWKYTQCEDCTLDYYTYKWEEPKKTSLNFLMPSAEQSNSSKSSVSIKTAPESTPLSTASETPSPSASTKDLLKAYDKIEDHEFDAEVVN